MAARAGQPVPRFREAYRRRRLEFDRGLSADEYWTGILRECGAVVTADALAWLDREDTLSWSVVNEPVLRWSQELRRAGLRVAILSNMPASKAEFFRTDERFSWIRSFDPVVFSCEPRVVKPEAGIYLLCLERLGIPPQECLFLDDTPENLQGAAAVGIPGYHFSTAERAAVDLRERGLPVESLAQGRS